MMLTKHIPSNINVEGNRVLLSYEGQPMTCYGCGEVGHLYSNCNKRRTMKTGNQLHQQTTYATIVGPLLYKL
jgi:hypothetical protein